jgi:arylsulfatase A-like enzyme
MAMGPALPFATSAAAQSEPANGRRPNFIILLTDDHGYHDLGCQGAMDVKTPYLDGLAASGVRFTNWYSGGASCVVARTSLLTGRYPNRTHAIPTYRRRSGNPGPAWHLPASELTIASLLKTAGYTTGMTGKWHLGSTPDSVPNAHGFDSFFGFHEGCIDYYSHRFYWGEPRRANFHDLWRNRTEIFEDGQYFTELITREAKNFITENHSKPFFLYVPYNGVHYPMHAPRKYVERFPDLEPERRMYAAMLSAVDDSVGEIVGLVRKLGLLENTFIFYAADNGATREARAGLNQQPATAGNDFPFRGFKWSLFDGGMHVPAIMSWPGRIPPRQVAQEVGCHIDILPTFCKAAGVSLPGDRAIDGRDVLPMAASGAKSPHDALFWASDGQLAARRGNWKVVENGHPYDSVAKGPLQGDDALFLSNLKEDPGESRNRRHDEPAVADELTTLAHHWLESIEKENRTEP